MFLSKLLSPGAFTSTPATAITEQSLNFEKTEQQRKSVLVNFITLILTLVCCLWGAGNLLLELFVGHQLLFIIFIGASVLCGFIYASAYWLLRIKNAYSQSVLLTISQITISISVIYALCGTKVAWGVAFVLPITLLIVLLDQKLPLILVSVHSIGFTVGLYLLQDFTRIYSPPVVLSREAEAFLGLFLILTIIICVGVIIYLPIKSQLNLLKTRTTSLQTALDELNIKQASGQVVSREVLAVAAELTSVATQQAGGSQEQVATVSQVNSSVQELSAAASQIKQIVYQVEKATTSMTQDSHRIENTTTNSVVQAREGLRAVSQTLEVSQDVSELYRELLVKTEYLAQRSNQMRQILQLLDSISEETHLLSLNAAIEAAGAGEFGERFAVVAGEVKNLSQRSKKAGQDVVKIVEEISSYSYELMQVARSGSKRANQLEEIAYQTGQRIEELQKVARQAQEQANSITRKAEEVENLTQIIHISTAQQSSASEQVLLSLNDLMEVTQQGANGSEVVAKTAHFLEELSHTLNKTLVITELDLDNAPGNEDLAPIIEFPIIAKTG